MIAAPAVDLKEGRCVQLIGGQPNEVAVSLPDPVLQAEQWFQCGFATLHVVDLDAALGTGDNLNAIRKVVQTTEATTQVGGGIRDDAKASALLEIGVDRIVVGTRALDDPDWLATLTRTHPGRVVVAVDTRGGKILRKGWTEETTLEVASYLPSLESLPLAGILSTNVGREGRLGGIDRSECSEVVALSPHPIWVSGGITTTDELAYLEEIGAAGVVLGMALYTETLNVHDVATKWGGANTARDP